MKAHLLFHDADLETEFHVDVRAQDTSSDLGLDAIIDAAAAGDPLIADVTHIALLSPVADADRIRYRQNATADALSHPDLIQEMYELCAESLEVQKELYGALSNYPISVLHRCVEAMSHLLDDLERLRGIAEEGRQVFTSAAFTALCAMVLDQVDDPYLTETRQLLAELRFPNGIFTTARLGRALKGVEPVLRHPPARSGHWLAQRIRLPGPVLAYRLPDRDEAGANALNDLRSRAVSSAANACSRAVDHVHAFFRSLQTELAFHLGAVNLHRRLSELGAPTSFPCVADDLWTAEEIYDVALALTTARVPVGNSIDADGAGLVVVTGANQGGKTTFLRALGQNQLLGQAGLIVGARSLTLIPATGVFTHFEHEEDAELEHGRLDDELVRIDDIATRLSRGALVFFNEPLTSTNEREGSEIARQILRALREHQVRAVVVTHMYDLAHSLLLEHRDDHRFLRAERRDDGTRTFRIVPDPPLTTSYARDLAERILGAV